MERPKLSMSSWPKLWPTTNASVEADWRRPSALARSPSDEIAVMSAVEHVCVCFTRPTTTRLSARSATLSA